MVRASMVAGAVAAAAAVQVGPGATWLPRVRQRWFPTLTSPMSPGTLAVTFDDGPHPDGTPAILDALDRLDWPATFFVLGTEAARHPELVREIAARGHAVGVHGREHRYLIARTPWGAAADLSAAIDTVTDITSIRPSWWRPPYGVLSGPGWLAARALRVRPLLWSAWGKDWTAAATGATVTAEAERGRLSGGTLLLHDSDITSATDSWKATLAALPLLAARLDVLGVRVARLP